MKPTRSKDDERVLDVEITEAGLALKADGQLAAVELAGDGDGKAKRTAWRT